jgi:serine/threonine protein kinase
LDKYEWTLKQSLDNKLIPRFDVDSFMAQIESAIEHLHSLGLAHNDLNPMNIMVDHGDEKLYLIDFGSCRPYGCELITAGTYGWVDEDYSTSARRNDEVALEKLRTWLLKMKEQLD